MRIKGYGIPCLLMFVVFNTVSYFGGLPVLICSANTLSADGITLLELKSSFVVPRHDVLSTWRNDSFSAVDPCGWEGVHCSSFERRVISISLPYKGLSGSLSSVIGKMAALEKLDLSGNRLSGAIPTQIANCTGLRELNLANNFFTGFIPPNIGNCSLLTVLNISTNNISGFIPSELGSLARLITLSLDTNDLTGIIPSSLGNLKTLEMMALYTNDLTGTIPPSISNCSSLEIIVIYQNSLDGTIPGEIALLENLRYLLVYENHLKGSIPEGFFSRLLKLEGLDASTNSLTGTIPYEIGNLKNLAFLQFDYNNMSGSIPSSISNLTSLQVLDLSHNNFEGTLPKGIGLLPNLEEVYISENMFEGQLPAGLGSFGNLTILDSYSNGLSGSIPSGLCNRKSLTRLILFDNRLEGNITGLLQDCFSLKRVRLQNNFFTGFIPSNISKLSALKYLEISHNNIEGSIPSALGQMQNLTNLLLVDNYLGGVIPPEIGELTNLGRLNLSRNNFTGTIPPEIGNLINLEVLDLSRNLLEGSIPVALGHLMMLSTLNLSANALTGRIPSSLGDCRQLSELYLARNKLSMTIPSELGKLSRSLRYGLDLSWNNLSGSLPPQIGILLFLESLDVSHNRLSGNIPQSLTGMRSLYHFNFSFNLFTGSIPSLGNFLQDRQNAFKGNPGLCGPPTMKNCSDSEVASKKNKLSSVGVAGITVACMGTITIIVLALIKTSRAKNNREDSTLGIYSGNGEGILKYRDIGQATDNFSNDYLIGCGSSGMVYKVAIPGRDKILAAKCIEIANHHHHNENRYSSLRREIETLKNVRHRNILRHRHLITANDVTILLCDYMVNGSLREFLDGASKRPNHKLDWRRRYNIAMGVAEGLKYLHHDCEPPMIHCDIKSANILLDHEYVAHIADFGLAKQLKNPSIDSESSSLFGGTLGYIAPECGQGVKASTKQDVYSFGVVLLEMVSGNSPVVEEEDQEYVHLTAWTARMTKQGRMDEIIDENLRSCSSDSYYKNMKDEILKIIEIATICTRSAPDLRPSMNVALQMLHCLRCDG